jgi:YidC/Oxa1 family membrane protein insertase
MWMMFVDGIGKLLAQLASLMDSSYGLAVIALALAVRLALLPLTLRAAEQGWLRQRKLAELKPEIEALRQRHAGEPAAQAAALQALYRRHGIGGGLGSGLLTALVQAPLGMGIYAAVRRGAAGAGSFLWIPKLARPDLGLALLVAALSLAAAMPNPMLPEQARTLLQWLPALVAFFTVWHLLAAGLGLYWLSSSTATVAQTLLLRQRIRRLSDRSAG